MHRLPDLALVLRAVVFEWQVEIEIGILQVRGELAAHFLSERRLRLQRRRAARQGLDIGQTLANDTDAEHRERRGHLGLMRFEHRVHRTESTGEAGDLCWPPAL